MGTKITTTSLRKFNFIMAGLHAAQALAVLALSKDFVVPVTGSYLTLDMSTIKLVPAKTTLFNIHFVWLIVVFFGLSAVAHLLIATVYNKTYNANLKKGINKMRWIEYALSASTMMVAIALLVGVYDASSLFMLFVLTAVMNLMGLVMEVTNQGAQKTKWLSYWIGCLAGAAPWVVIAFYMWLSAANGSRPPTFVYWIFVSIFVFFNCFAINMVLQYKKIGPWKDYLYGERAYIILSLVAKSLLAWQVFAGTLRP
ncbi:MAG TPA: heliorhodopsin HeR [Patescibacteria group bacterium]|nr:heliorhodopsin HeR [Patescibacteria group bacterium]